MIRSVLAVTVCLGFGTRFARANPTTIRCDNESTAELNIDGLLDDWPDPVRARAGGSPAGAFDLRCSWDGAALAVAVDVRDDRVVRVRRGKAHEDHVSIEVGAVGAGQRATAIDVYPGTAIATPRISAPRGVKAADSLQPKGFSVEASIPARAIPGLSGGTAALSLHVVFHDSDAATGGADSDVDLDAEVELADRADLFDDFLRTVHLHRSDLRFDQLAKLDPDHPGKLRIVAGGTVIGVLGEQFAFVSLPVTRAADVKSVQLLPLGPKGQQVVAAIVDERGNGGSRQLLMLWTVWSGQLQPLGQIEIEKQRGTAVLASKWHVITGAKPELWVEPLPATGVTADSWNEEPATDADSIVLPWDATRSGVAYRLTGVELARRDLPKHRK